MTETACASSPPAFSGDHPKAESFMRSRYNAHAVKRCAGTVALKAGGWARISPSSDDVNNRLVKSPKEGSLQLKNPQEVQVDNHNNDDVSETWFVATSQGVGSDGLTVFINRNAVKSAETLSCTVTAVGASSQGILKSGDES